MQTEKEGPTGEADAEAQSEKDEPAIREDVASHRAPDSEADVPRSAQAHELEQSKRDAAEDAAKAVATSKMAKRRLLHQLEQWARSLCHARTLLHSEHSRPTKRCKGLLRALGKQRVETSRTGDLPHRRLPERRRPKHQCQCRQRQPRRGPKRRVDLSGLQQELQMTRTQTTEPRSKSCPLPVGCSRAETETNIIGCQTARYRH